MISNIFSKSFKSLFFLLLFVGFSSAFAKPYPGPQGAADSINDRQANQDKRIAAGKAAGQISPQEELWLNQMVEFINAEETKANKSNKNKRIKGSVKVKGSGNIDAAEFHEIMGMLDLLSDRIKISREAEAVALAMPNAPIQPVSAPTGSNVAQGKQPYPGPQGAADIINDRQANQDKRIAAGKAAGQISPQEEAQLNQMVEFINNAETKANLSNKVSRKKGSTKVKGSGNINEKEFHEIMGMLDQLSAKIWSSGRPYPGPQRAADIISERQVTQDKRIAAGKAAGHISPQEELWLNQMVELIASLEMNHNKSNSSARAKGALKAPGSGHIDEAPFHEIMEELNELTERVREANYPGPKIAADMINERQAIQDKRLAAGKAAGQISPQEEAQLNQMVEFINNAETKANLSNKVSRKKGSTKVKGSGNINEKEFHEIMGMLDQLSAKINISIEAEFVAAAMPTAR